MFQRAFAGANPSRVRAQNTSAILLALLNNQGLSRIQIADMTGLSPTTITNLASSLISDGIVVEEGKVKSDEPSVGRPQKALFLDENARYAIAVHVNVDYVRIAVCNLVGKAVLSETIDLSPSDDSETVLEEVAHAVHLMLRQNNIDRRNIVGMGVAASGLVDPYTGVNIVSPNLGWKDVPLQDYFESQFGMPVVVNNNVRAMALGEAMFGVAKDVQSVAFVYSKIGVGAGFVVDGQLYQGSVGGAGEIGHTTLVLKGGDVCRCGNTGCLETLVSERVIIRQAIGVMNVDSNQRHLISKYMQRKEFSTMENIFDAASGGDQTVLNILETSAEYMGVALANLVNTLNPELIVLGGIFAQGQDLMLPTVKETLWKRTFAKLGQEVRVEATSFNDVGVVGAAALALDACFYRQITELN